MRRNPAAFLPFLIYSLAWLSQAKHEQDHITWNGSSLFDYRQGNQRLSSRIAPFHGRFLKTTLWRNPDQFPSSTSSSKPGVTTLLLISACMSKPPNAFFVRSCRTQNTHGSKPRRTGSRCSGPMTRVYSSGMGQPPRRVPVCCVLKARATYMSSMTLTRFIPR